MAMGSVLFPSVGKLGSALVSHWVLYGFLPQGLVLVRITFRGGLKICKGFVRFPFEVPLWGLIL